MTPTLPSRRASHSANDPHFQSRPASRAARGIPSTRASMRERYPECSGAVGASENPQFPPKTVVTPWSGDGLALGSQNSWAS